MNSFTQKKTYWNFRTNAIYFPFEARKKHINSVRLKQIQMNSEAGQLTSPKGEEYIYMNSMNIQIHVLIEFTCL